MADQELWTILKVLNWTKEFLLSKGVVNGRLEAEWLLCDVTGLDRVGLYLQYDKPLSEQELAKYRAMVARRGRREPLQHILRSQEVYGLDFVVSPDVLIPRHDTEVLIAEAISRCPEAHSVLDIGTGSGCIAVALQKQLVNAHVVATDVSEGALVVARENAARHNVKIEFLHGSLLEPVSGRRFDLIVSNPPYIPTADISLLEPEVRDHDPHIALDGGCDGLTVYRKLIPAALEYLNSDGWLLVEVGIGQAQEVSQIFLQAGGYHAPITVLDSGRIERVVGAKRKEAL